MAGAALEITAIVSVHHGGRFRHLLAITRTLHGHPAPHRHRQVTWWTVIQGAPG